MLWRALRQVEQGFYVDVGAGSPDLDSVTRAFSERGWRGINIEPHPKYFAQLAERRPSDINLNVAVGDCVGVVSMHLVDNSGLSTADEGIARSHREAGLIMTEATVDLTTLAAILQQHLDGSSQIHFLKVDVEGFERAVLNGNDWNLFRPWILVIEATLPNSQIEAHEEWENILIEAGYLFVYADGLNRYYVAREQSELGNAFKYPPNVFDAFTTADALAARQQLGLLEVSFRDALVRVETGERSLIEARERYEVINRLLKESTRRIECTEQALVASRQRETDLAAKLERPVSVATFLKSHYRRLKRPFRKLLRFKRR